MATPVTAIFDIGKTNKKFFLFDRDLKELHQAYKKFSVIEDDDGYSCDDLEEITKWIRQAIDEISASPEYILEGINFSTYGATLVHLDGDGKPVTPLYNYLKPFPEEVLKKFDSRYHVEVNNLETASPFLGMLNSGLQLYWIKHDKPELFSRIKHTAHFPQYLSYLVTGKLVSEPTSIGCHTKLWDFKKNAYHSWLTEEGLLDRFSDIVPSTHAFGVKIRDALVKVGVGIHDSSAALTSYLLRSAEPFVLISTGTWSIVLNPFTTDELTTEELQRDCLNYMTIEGKPVRASRLFLGSELDHQLGMLCEKFHKDEKYYKKVALNKDFIPSVERGVLQNIFYPATIDNPALVREVSGGNRWDPIRFTSFEEAYHHVVWGLVGLQVASLRLALGTSGVRKIYVDGGFIDNEIFIRLLQFSLPGFDIEVSRLPLGSAYGAASVLQAG